MKVPVLPYALSYLRALALPLLLLAAALPLAADPASVPSDEDSLLLRFQQALQDGSFAKQPPSREASAGPIPREIFEYEIERQGSDGVSGDFFGTSVSIGQDYAAIGAPNKASDTGAVYIYGRNAGGTDQWGQVKKITLATALPGDLFGTSVSVAGDLVAVGAIARNATRGAAYIFNANTGGNNNFGLIKEIVGSNSNLGDSFGRSVALNATTLVVGAHKRISSNGLYLSGGAAYLFEKDLGGTGNWGQRKILVPSEELPFAEYGISSAISGDTVVVGSRVSSFTSGRIYVFERDAGGSNAWGESKKISSPGGVNLDQFGAAVDIDHDTIVVGASRNNSAYVYGRNTGGAGVWGLVKLLKSSINGVNDEFGVSVAVSGDVVLVGAQAINSTQGKAFAFQRNSGGTNNWGETAILPNQAIVPNSSFFGASVDVSSRAAVVGAPKKGTFRGAAFFFNNCPSVNSGSFFFTAAESNNTIGVTAQGLGCSWMATTNDSWIQFTGSTSGTTSGAVPFKVTANNTGVQRTGTINLNGEVIEVTQRSTLKVFDDVNAGDFFFDPANRLSTKGITDGCAAGVYCPGDNVTRGQMAVFIIRAIFGGDGFVHPTTPFFTDVPSTHPFFKWIQMMRELGITDGCGVGIYCPGDFVTRGQMAVFIIRARIGPTEVFPFSPTPVFSDVGSSNPFFAYIQKMRELAITDGCAPGLYCPEDFVTRGQMAVFIMRGACNEFLPAGAPLILSISPNSGTVGTAVPVTIVGSNTTFTTGVSTVSLGAGITVSSIVVNSTTNLTATLTIAGGAAVYPRSVNVRTGTVEANLPHGFTLLAGGGSSLSAAPSRALPGLAAPTLQASEAGRTAMASRLSALPEFLVRGQTLDLRSALAWGGSDARLNGEALSLDDSQRTVLSASGAWSLETSAGTRHFRITPDYGTSLKGRLESAASGRTARVWSTGLRADYYEFSDPLTRLPEFSTGAALSSSTFTTVAVRGADAVGAAYAPDYGIRLTGYLLVPAGGVYRFGLWANEGARLLIDGEEVLRADDSAGLDAGLSGGVPLRAGWRQVVIEYYSTVEMPELRWSWGIAGGRLEPVAEEYLLSSVDLPLRTAPDGTFVIGGLPSAPAQLQLWVLDAEGDTVAMSPFVAPVRSAAGPTVTSLGSLGSTR